MERHLEIFRFCKTRIIDSNELSDAADAIEWVYDAVWYRHEELKGEAHRCRNGSEHSINLLLATFKRQRRNIDNEFSTYSFGLVSFHYLFNATFFIPNLFKSMNV